MALEQQNIRMPLVRLLPISSTRLGSTTAAVTTRASNRSTATWAAAAAACTTARSTLATKGQYNLVSINEEQDVEPFAIDGYAMRTPEEDETHVEEAVDPKKGAVKGKKK